jgi:DNA-binding LacI/PurR family transcriptional regulator
MDGAGVTMEDVAREAGVSRALVSIVLRDVPGASEKTRDHVKAVAAQLGYRPDHRARLLGRHRSGMLGVSFSVKHTFHGDLVEQLYPAADAEGFEVGLSAVAATRDEEESAESLINFRCEALLLLGPTLRPAQLEKLAAIVPTIVMVRRVEVPGVSVVRTDDRDGVRQAVDHLAALGHKDICHIHGGTAAGAAERRQGYRSTMKKLGLSSHLREILGGLTEEDGARAAEELIASGQMPTAITAFNDRCALGVLITLWDSGIKVPEDVSLVGFDDSRLASLSHVDLTTVRQDAYGLSTLAVRAAVQRIQTGARPGETVVPPTLIVRGTTGPVPKRTSRRIK